MAFLQNIIPEYSHMGWSHPSGASASSLNVQYSGSGTSTYIWASAQFVIGASAKLEVASATADFYVGISYKEPDQTQRHYYSVKFYASAVPQSVQINLIGATVDDIMITIHALEACTIGVLSLQFENTQTNSSSSSSELGTLQKSFNRTFVSAPYQYPNNRWTLDFTNKLYYTVATLDLRLDPDIMRGESSGAPGDTKSSWLSVDIEGSVSLCASSDFVGLLLIFFGDRLLTQRRFVHDQAEAYSLYTIRATLNASRLMPADLAQNIPLKLVLYANTDGNNTMECCIDAYQTMISATGPIVLNEFRAHAAIDPTTAPVMNAQDVVFEYGGAGQHSAEPSAVYYMLNVRGNAYYVQPVNRSGWDALPTLSGRTFDRSVPPATFFKYSPAGTSNTRKYRIGFVTEIHNYWDMSQCTAATGTMVHVVLDTSGNLRIYNAAGTSYFTLDTSVTDFDMCQCGVRGTGNTDPFAEPPIVNFSFWERRIFGFSIIYIKNNQVYFAIYPDVDIDVGISSPVTLSNMRICQVTMPSNITSPSRITLNPLYRTGRVYIGTSATSAGNGFISHTLYFGVTLYSNSKQYFGYLGASIPTNGTTSSHDGPQIAPVIDSELLFCRMYSVPYQNHRFQRATPDPGMNELPSVDPAGEQALVGTVHSFTPPAPGIDLVLYFYTTVFSSAMYTAGNTYMQSKDANYMLYDAHYAGFNSLVGALPIADIVPDISMFSSVSNLKLFTMPTGDIGYIQTYPVEGHTDPAKEYFIMISFGAMPKIHLYYNILNGDYSLTPDNAGYWDSFMVFDPEGASLYYADGRLECGVLETDLLAKLRSDEYEGDDYNWLPSVKWTPDTSSYMKVSSNDINSVGLPSQNISLRSNKHFYSQIICNDSPKVFPVGTAQTRIMWVHPAFTHKNQYHYYRPTISRNDLIYTGWIPIKRLES